MKLATLIILYLINFSLFAKAFQIVDRQYGSLPAASITLVDAALDQLENEVNADLPDADQSTYLKGMANANVMSAKGSSDYANDVKLFLLKYSVGIGADIGDNTLGDAINGTVEAKQLRGASFQLGFTAGLNLGVLPFKSIGPIETKRADVFLHVGSLNNTSDDQSFSLVSKSLGFYFRYKVHPGKTYAPLGVLDWQGIYLTTGVETHDMLLKLNVNVSETVTVSGLGSATLAGSVLAGVDMQTTSIPIELSTNLQWMYFFTTYFGLAADINTGTATSLATSSVTLSSSIGGVGGSGQLDLGTTNEPSPIWMRWFIGQQFNLTFLKINAQIDHVPGKGYWGANLGIGITY